MNIEAPGFFHNIPRVYLVDDTPRMNTAGEAIGWRAYAREVDSVSERWVIHTYAICVDRTVS